MSDSTAHPLSLPLYHAPTEQSGGHLTDFEDEPTAPARLPPPAPITPQPAEMLAPGLDPIPAPGGRPPRPPRPVPPPPPPPPAPTVPRPPRPAVPTSSAPLAAGVSHA